MSRKNNLNDKYEDSSIEFETLLNCLNEWENNPIEASRHCLKNLYNIIRYQQKRIETIEKNKISNLEFNSCLNAKANIADFMNSLNEITQNIEKRPTYEKFKIYLEDKISKKEINEYLKSRPSLEEIKSYLMSGDIKINFESLKEDLNRNFVNFKNLSDILATKPNKEHILNLLNQKANKNEIVKINNELQILNTLDQKVQEIDNNLEKIANNFNQKINEINNDYKSKIDKKDFNDISNKLNIFESKLNDYSNDINYKISDLDKQINLITNKYESMDKSLKIYLNNFEENFNKEKENISLINNENSDNKINSICKDINKIYSLLDSKNNKYEIESLKLQVNEINSKSKFLSDQQYITSQEMENFYNTICEDIHLKFMDMENYTQNFLKKLDNNIAQNINNKASNEEINMMKMDINQIKYLLDQKGDLNIMNNLEDALNSINQNYINKNEYLNFVQICQNDMQEMKNDIILKSNIEETMSYLKNKANINDVNTALNQIHDELDNKISIQDFNHAMNNLNKINSALLQNNQVGEWLWESGIVKNNHYVSWEIQKINNCPENFIWSKDSDIIVVKQKGIYLISLAFFMQNNAFIQLYINGEIVLSKNNTEKELENENNFNNLKKNLIVESQTGISISEFILLQEKSRICVLYDGTDNVKGVLALKMLCNI